MWYEHGLDSEIPFSSKGCKMQFLTSAPSPSEEEHYYLIMVLQEVPYTRKFRSQGASIITLLQRCALVILDAADVLAASCSPSALRADVESVMYHRHRPSADVDEDLHIFIDIGLRPMSMKICT